MTDSPAVAAALDMFRRSASGRASPAFGLDHIKRALAKLGGPQDRIPPAVHVTGTNGKGSTAAFIRAMAEAAGLKVHVFTSPHLTRVNERIRVASRLVEDAALIDALSRVHAAGPDLTYFEALCASAFLLFSETPADIAVVEVGAGGEGDATNVMLRPAVTVFTPISLDHEAMLGVKGVDGIARVKAGIMRAGVPAVIARQSPDAERVLRERAAQIGAPVAAMGHEWSAAWDGQGFAFDGARLTVRSPGLGLAGRHQADNAGAACAVLEIMGFDIAPDVMAAGLREARWPARLQKLKDGPLVEAAGKGWGGAVIVDAGHNPAGMATLAEAIRLGRQHAGGDKASVILATQRTKDVPGMLAPLMAAADEVIACRLPDSGGQEGFDPVEPQAIAEKVAERGGSRLTADDLKDAVKLAASRGARRIYVTGSLYLCGDALRRNEEVVV